MDKKTTCLIIMDGFGYPRELKRSAITKSNTKFLQSLAMKYPATLIHASEGFVGLPKGQSGTSEVGHLTIGTGRINKQKLVMINDDIKSGVLFKNPSLVRAMENAKTKGKALHLLGIPTDGGVHGHINHLFALLKMAKENNVRDVYIHFFADGRDVPPKSAKKYVTKVENYCKNIGVGKIANVIGRFYALDRDKNWDRVEKAYDCIVRGKGFTASSAQKAVDMAYGRGETDEFILPTVVTTDKPIVIKGGDSIISYNYRADRERQLAYVFDPDNDLTYTDKKLKTVFVCMCEYDKTLKNCLVAYKEKGLKNILSEYISEKGLSQLKLAETEKFAYITYAFNNWRVDPYPNEERILIPSKKLKLYSENPEMGAYQIAEKAIEGIESGKYDAVILNFANCDMVGHSGDMSATKIAVKTVDECVKKVVEAVEIIGGNAIITADHGNADEMVYPDGGKNTSHTTALVPFMLAGKEFIGRELRKKGTLADIAPTILDVMGLEKPVEMTGNSLLYKTKH